MQILVPSARHLKEVHPLHPKTPFYPVGNGLMHSQPWFFFGRKNSFRIIPRM